ncbi:hypothetical protein STEG23_001321, partial [Scotinomys teguina]
QDSFLKGTVLSRDLIDESHWKRRRDDDEEDNHPPSRSKRNKKDQDFQDPQAIESSSSDNERIHNSINNPKRESVPESSLNQNIAELNSNIPEFSRIELSGLLYSFHPT